VALTGADRRAPKADPVITSASATGQDALVVELLGFLRGGFFLDSGASDGVVGSNTLVLERDLGWDGICVEPDPGFFAALAVNRRCRLVNTCLYEHDGEVDFVAAGVLGGVVGDYHPQLLDLASRTYGVPRCADGTPATTRRPARTVGAVLDEAGAPGIIDYWSLDTEGSELTILRSFPFERYQVRVLTVEHNNFPARDEIRRFLGALGYVVVAALPIDDCFARPDLVDLHAFAARRAVAGWRSASRRRRP
jgi:hypothetical protein